MVMPPRPAPGIRYMDAWDWQSITVESRVFRSNEKIIDLPVSGGILAIHVTLRNIDDPMPANLHGEDYRAKFTVHADPSAWDEIGSFTWSYTLTDCGMAFKIPVPNVNAANPLYLLRNSPEQCPDLTVHVVSLRPK